MTFSPTEYHSLGKTLTRLCIVSIGLIALLGAVIWIAEGKAIQERIEAVLYQEETI